jgi:hypothetical protein
MSKLIESALKKHGLNFNVKAGSIEVTATSGPTKIILNFNI